MKLKRTLDTYLPPDPKQTSAAGDTFINSLGFLIVLACISLIGATLMRDSRTAAKVPIQANQWKIAYLASLDSDCSRDLAVGKSCPASPENKELWESSLERGSPEFYKIFEQKSGASYWMGTVIPANKLREAAQLAAPVLILPKTNGSTSVWIDGVFQVNHRFQDQGLPAQVTLPRQRLMENRDLHVAVLVSPYPNYSAPEAQAASSSEGLFSSVEADHLMRWEVFDGLTRNLIFTGLFLLLAGILWAASADNRIAYDYVVGRQLALMLALISLLSMDITSRQLSVPTVYRLHFVLLLLEGFFVLRMTASILRLTRSSSWKLAAGLLAGAVLVFLLTPWGWIETSGLKLMNSIVLPCVYGVSAILIGHRAISMYRNRGDASIERVQFLFISSGAFIAAAGAYFIESSLRHALEVEWSRALNFVTIYFLVRMYIRSRRRKITFIDSLPVSKHHADGVEGSQIHGWLLQIRLSSPRTWIKSKKNPQIDAGTVNAVLSHVWTIMQVHGGEIVKHDGHCFHVFFEHRNGGNEVMAVKNALHDLEAALRILGERLKIEAPEGAFHPQMSFHATVVKASAQAIWKVDGEVRRPSWNVHPSAVLTETHEEHNGRSEVVMSAEDAAHFSDLPESIALKKVPDKAIDLVA